MAQEGSQGSPGPIDAMRQALFPRNGILSLHTSLGRSGNVGTRVTSGSLRVSRSEPSRRAHVATLEGRSVLFLVEPPRPSPPPAPPPPPLFPPLTQPLSLPLFLSLGFSGRPGSVSLRTGWWGCLGGAEALFSRPRALDLPSGGSVARGAGAPAAPRHPGAGVEQRKRGCGRPPPSSSPLVGLRAAGRSGRNPSDNSLAVGPDHIVQIVNSRMAIFTKKGKRFDTTGKVLYGAVRDEQRVPRASAAPARRATTAMPSSATTNWPTAGSS